MQQGFVILDTPFVELPLLLLYDLTDFSCNLICTNPYLHGSVVLFLSNFQLPIYVTQLTLFISVFSKYKRKYWREDKFLNGYFLCALVGVKNIWWKIWEDRERKCDFFFVWIEWKLKGKKIGPLEFSTKTHHFFTSKLRLKKKMRENDDKK